MCPCFYRPRCLCLRVWTSVCETNFSVNQLDRFSNINSPFSVLLREVLENVLGFVKSTLWLSGFGAISYSTVDYMLMFFVILNVQYVTMPAIDQWFITHNMSNHTHLFNADALITSSYRILFILPYNLCYSCTMNLQRQYVSAVPESNLFQ